MSTILKLYAGEYNRGISFPLSTDLILTGATVTAYYRGSSSSGSWAGSIVDNAPYIEFTEAQPVPDADTYTIDIILTGSGYRYEIGPYSLTVLESLGA